jgi:sugar-phosphatase
MEQIRFIVVAILFDLDGTLVDSTAHVERIWRGWAVRHGHDPEVVRVASHGRRTIETVREFAPHLDAEAETRQLDAEEMDCTRGGIVEIRGASELLRKLPEGRWAVVTSAARAGAEARIRAVGLPMPRVLIAADDVSRGKPAPDAYLMAARKLDVRPERCLVIEDTPAGLQAGVAAGMQVLGITTTFPEDELGGHRCVVDLSGMRVRVEESGVVMLEA